MDLNKDGKLNGRPVTHADYNDPTGGADGGDGEGGTGGVVIPTGQNSYPTFVTKPWSEGKPPVAVTMVAWISAVGMRSKEEFAWRVRGASLHRDPVDTRLFAELASLGIKGKIIKDEAESGGIGEIKPAACTGGY